MFLRFGSPRSRDGEIDLALTCSKASSERGKSARLGDAFQPRGDIYAVAHQVAVALLDHIAEMDADAEFDARSGGSPALRSAMPLWTSMAQRTASTTLRNSMRMPSPVRLTTRP